jgi:hypothetical protein
MFCCSRKSKSLARKKVHGNKLRRIKVGDKLGKLTILRRVKSNPGVHDVTWIAACDCTPAKELRIREQYFFRVANPKRHCGCDGRTLATIYKREYGIWKMMNRRCYFPSHAGWPDYGGRGISVHPAWRDLASQGLEATDKNDTRDLEAFTRFFNFMGAAPTPEHTLDRKDPNGHYQPGNMRWATPAEQAMNKRNVIEATNRMNAWRAIAKSKREGNS